MKKEINNSVINFFLLIVSFIFWFFRSIKLLFKTWNYKIKNNLFFDFLDYLFKIWPKYFWEKPNFYKLFSMPGQLIDYIFNKK